MRLLMIGAGATGGYFGGRLAQAGRDVTFLVRGERAEQLRSNGLRIVSPHGDLTLQPQLLGAEQLQRERPFDLILVSTKAYSLEAAMENFAPAVGPDTLLLPMLNGMRHLDTLDQRFGRNRVLGGSVRIVADLDAEGRVEQRTRLGELSYGERGGERNEQSTARLEAIDRELRVPGIDAILQPDILATLWQKWWILSSIGAICVLGHGAIGQVAEVPFGVELARAVIAEATAIAEANGYTPDPAMLADHLVRLTERGSALTSSMYRDMLKGAPVEADHILGDLLARRGAVPASLLSAAYVQLGVYQAARS